MNTCTNCGSSEPRELGFIGRIAPFFLKRVFNIERRVPVSPDPIKELFRRIGHPARQFFSKIYSKEAYLEMQICESCSFLQARRPFPEDWINRLYLGYRSESYDRECIYYEPSYRLIPSQVGVDPLEVHLRALGRKRSVPSFQRSSD